MCQRSMLTTNGIVWPVGRWLLSNVIQISTDKCCLYGVGRAHRYIVTCCNELQQYFWAVVMPDWTIITAVCFIGGIPADRLIVPVSDHSVSTPMHLRLEHKEKVWTGEYVVDEEDGIGGTEAVGDDEVNNFDGEDMGKFDSKSLENNEDEDVEEDGDQEVEEWGISDFSSQSSEHLHSQQHDHQRPEQKAEEIGEAPVAHALSQAEAGDLFRSRLSKYRALRRLGRLQRLRCRGGLGFRLSQHWKSWRQQARWMCSVRHRWSHKGQRNTQREQRRLKRYEGPPYGHEEYDGSDDGHTESDRGTYSCGNAK